MSFEQQQAQGQCRIHNIVAGDSVRRTCGACGLGLILLGPSKPAALGSALLAFCNADLDGVIQIT